MIVEVIWHLMKHLHAICSLAKRAAEIKPPKAEHMSCSDTSHCVLVDHDGFLLGSLLEMLIPHAFG